MRKIAAFIASFLLFAGLLKAADVEFTVSAPKVVDASEQFAVTFSLNAKPGKNIIFPKFNDFVILGGPSQSSSSSISIINNKVTQSVTYAYTFYLQPQKAGTFSVSSAVAEVDGKVYTSRQFTIEVVGSGGAAAQQRPQQGADKATQAVTTAEGDELFLKVLVDKSSVYAGEKITATIKIYSRVAIAGSEEEKYPSFAGFFKQDLPTPQLRQLERENVNGEIWYSGVLKRMVLYPQKNGDIFIDPVEMQLVVNRVVQSARQRSIWDEFFDSGPSYQQERKRIKSRPVKIQVKPLPANAPESFNGAVGDFTFVATADKLQVKANDAVTLRFTIKGKGNLKLIEAPKINFSPDFEVYDPKTTENIDENTGGSTGSRTFEYVIIPRHSGNYTIPATEFSFFNTQSGKYVSLLSKKFDLIVARGDGESTAVVSSVSRDNVTYIGKDIRFIKTKVNGLYRIGSDFYGSLWYVLSLILIVVVTTIAIVLGRKTIRENANLAVVRNKRANKMAVRRLKVAKQHMDANARDRFYDEVLKALWGYIGDKLNIPTSDLSRQSAFDKLQLCGIDDSMLLNISQLIDNCEYQRYAPGSNDSQMTEVYKQTVNVITTLDQKLKK